MWLPFTTSDDEMEWVYSFNPRARMGQNFLGTAYVTVTVIHLET